MKNIERGKRVNIIFYAGYKADEHPAKILIDGKELIVKKAIPIGLFRTPNGFETRKFYVATSEGNTYLIRQRDKNSWIIENYGP